MKRLFQLLIYGHVHKWKIISERRFNYDDGFTRGDCNRYILQCEHCGEITVRDARAGY